MNLQLASAFVIAFLMGAFPTAYLVVRFMKGQDIRTLGSGNPGATNVFRSCGKTAGFLVLIVDILKGALAVSLVAWVFPFEIRDFATYKLLLGISAILGHVFTPFLGFKGGKGVATGSGVGLGVYPLSFLAAFLVWAAVLAKTRYMSLASLLAVYAFALASFLFIPDRLHTVITLGLAIFITWTHRGNISRLQKGNENRFF